MKKIQLCVTEFCLKFENRKTQKKKKKKLSEDKVLTEGFTSALFFLFVK